MNTLQELKERIRFRNTNFQRNYESRYYWFPEESPPFCIIEVNQYDPYHDITLYLEVDLTTMKIVKSGVEEKRVPYETCPAAIKTYDYLVGEDMSYVKLMNRFPTDKTLGCLHINELIQNAAMNFHSAYAFYLKERNFPARLDEYKMYEGNLPAQERREIGRHWWMKDRGVRNSCYSFSGRHEKPEPAKKKLKTRYLTDCTLITSLEPCLMCTGTILLSRIPKIIYLLPARQGEGISSLSMEMIYSRNFFPELICIPAEISKNAFKSFFKIRRKKFN